MKGTIKITCPFCGKNSPVTVDYKDFNDWQSGRLVQDAFPYLSAGERELFISGLCPDCQKKVFGEED